MVRAAVVLRVLRLNFGRKHVSRDALGEIARYSSASFILTCYGENWLLAKVIHDLLEEMWFVALCLGER